MNIKIKGKHFDKDDKLHFMNLAEWCSIKLIGTDLSKDINLKINLVGLEMYKSDAFLATTELDGKNTSFPPKKFIITITNKFKILRSLMLLAHEMVHLKQHAIGELKWDLKNNTSIWMDKTYKDDDIDYWDMPWEIEAHGREKGLVHQWALETGRSNSKWYVEIF